MKTYPKKEKKAYQPRFLSNGAINPASSTYAQPTERQRRQLRITAHTEGGFSGSFSSEEEKQNWLEQRKRDSFNSKSF